LSAPFYEEEKNFTKISGFAPYIKTKIAISAINGSKYRNALFVISSNNSSHYPNILRVYLKP
jgi:hypothetical protein